MDNLFDYLKWMGDFPIEATGLLEADAMVFGVLWTRSSPTLTTRSRSATALR